LGPGTVSEDKGRNEGERRTETRGGRAPESCSDEIIFQHRHRKRYYEAEGGLGSDQDQEGTLGKVEQRERKKTSILVRNHEESEGELDRKGGKTVD